MTSDQYLWDFTVSTTWEVSTSDKFLTNVQVVGTRLFTTKTAIGIRAARAGKLSNKYLELGKSEENSTYLFELLK
jgi:hypothetical protein